MATAAKTNNLKAGAFQDKEKPAQVRNINIVAAKAVSDAIRTSLGPKGMDKMIQTKTGEVVITNDGATILKHISVMHPAAKMLVDLSAAQDVEAGDGTTSVVVFAGSLLGAAEGLLAKGIHPTAIAEGFKYAAAKAVEFLAEMSTPVDLQDRNALIQAASTSLNSKVVSQYSSLLAPIAVDSVLRVVDPLIPDNVDLKRIRIVKKVRGTIDDCELSSGLVLNQSIEKSAGGPQHMDKARIALLQFPISAPKPDMDSQIVVTDYRQMDRILKEERQYLLNICKAIKRTGCNVVLVQKSILREGVSDLALHFLSKLKVMVIRDIERDEIEFIAMTTGCRPIADAASLSEDRLGSAEWVGEEGGVVRIKGVSGRTSSVVLRGANGLVLEEAERSLHDAMCVVRCLVKKGAILPGGGAPEIAVSRRLSELHATGPLAECIKAFASAMEAVPATLAENAGLPPLSVITQLRNRHALGHSLAGINVKTGKITDSNQDVVQPLLVSTSAISLAAETVLLLLKIDDIISSR